MAFDTESGCPGTPSRTRWVLAVDERIATGWRLKAIAEPFIVCTHAQTPEEIMRPKLILQAALKHCEELGATLAAGIALGIF